MMNIHVALVGKYRTLQLNYRIILFNAVTTFYQLVTIYNASVNKVNNVSGCECIACSTSHSTIFQLHVYM